MSDQDGRITGAPGTQGVHSKNGERSPTGGDGQIEGYPPEWDGIANSGEISSTNVMTDTPGTDAPVVSPKMRSPVNQKPTM